ncbi:MAG: anti-sigma factor [Gammaproteobacteria bacterium]|nr:anti-sigma factor [Gammaproteobacteria bacterium]
MKLRKWLLKLAYAMDRTLPGLITCAEAEQFIDDYLDGRLAERERTTFERHIRLCPPCQSYLDAYRRSVTLTRLSPDDASGAMPEELVQAILAARDKSQH